MSHERLRGMLDDYASGTLTLPEREEVRAHLETCGECRDDARALHDLLADAAALPHDVAPPRDLWEGIAARLEPRASLAGTAPVAVERPGAPALLFVGPPVESPVEVPEEEGGARVVPFRKRTVQVPRWLLAAAAVTVMVLSSGVTALLMSPPAGGGGDVVEGEGVSSPSPAAGAVPTALVAFEQGERSYRAAIDDLERLLAAKRDRMMPETVATLERNLAIIDAAIDDSRRALEADPNNHELAQMLSSVYETKVSTLQRAVEL